MMWWNVSWLTATERNWITLSSTPWKDREGIITKLPNFELMGSKGQGHGAASNSFHRPSLLLSFSTSCHPRLTSLVIFQYLLNYRVSRYANGTPKTPESFNAKKLGEDAKSQPWFANTRNMYNIEQCSPFLLQQLTTALLQEQA